MSLTLPQGACFVRTLTALPSRLRGGAVAIGNFDGVHRGHQAVIDAARAVAKAQSIPLLCLTFEPHPRTVFARCRGESEAFRLTPGAEKILALADLGLDGIVLLRFTSEFARQTPDAFIQDILIKGLAARHIAIGADFRFGHERGGNAERLSAETAFTVTALQPCRQEGGEAFAATLIRQHLRQGEPEIAAELLGRPFTVTGRVRHGDKRGRRLGFPTANLALGEYLRPAFGVYTASIAFDRRLYRGVANLGRRPSIAEGGECLEVHLFDFSGDLYGQKIRVALHHFLRPERKFGDLDALTRQIARDVATARDKLISFC